jgi:hypothetical protein
LPDTTRDAHFNENAWLLMLVFVHASMSLIHFWHNALYLPEYPNMSPSFTKAGVVATWAGITAVGMTGFFVYRRSRNLGLVILALFAALGFGGLDHYAIAPIEAHSSTMHTTILGEVVSAAALLAFISWTARKNGARVQRA